MIDGVLLTLDTSHKIHDFYFGSADALQHVESRHPEAQLRRLAKT